MEISSYVLGSQHWEKKFKSLLFVVIEYIVHVWEIRKQILYGNDACPSHQVGDLGGGGGALELMDREVVSRTKEVSMTM